MSSPKSRNDEIYEQGVHDGQNAGGMDQFAHSLTKGYTFNPRENEIYNAGYAYGVAHRPQPSNRSSEADAAPSRSTVSASIGNSSGSDGSSDGLGLIAAPFYLIGAVWGLVAGFKEGGVLGALIGFALGGAAGALFGAAVAFMLGLALVVGFFYAIFWVLSHIF